MSNTNELSKNNWIVVIQGGVRLYVDDDGKKFFENVITNSVNFVKFEEEIFRGSSVMYIVKPERLEEGDNIRRGMWRCKEKGHWNDKGVTKCVGCYW